MISCIFSFAPYYFWLLSNQLFPVSPKMSQIPVFRFPDTSCRPKSKTRLDFNFKIVVETV